MSTTSPLTRTGLRLPGRPSWILRANAELRPADVRRPCRIMQVIEDLPRLKSDGHPIRLNRAILPLVTNKTGTALKFYRKDIRFPIPQATLRKQMVNQAVSKIQRIGKYLLLKVPEGAMLLHLGMSGRITLKTSMSPREKHTHAIFQFGNFLFKNIPVVKPVIPEPIINASQ